jgi:hypothetical protein
MAIIIGKGTQLKVEIASVLTAVANLISLDLPEGAAETFEADTLDNANPGIPHKATGRVEGGSVGFEGFLDPVLASFQSLTDMLNDPTLATTGDGGSITFADTAGTVWPFQIAGVTIGGTVQLGDGVKFSGSIKLDGIVTYPS